MHNFIVYNTQLK